MATPAALAPYLAKAMLSPSNATSRTVRRPSPTALISDPLPYISRGNTGLLQYISQHREGCAPIRCRTHRSSQPVILVCNTVLLQYTHAPKITGPQTTSRRCRTNLCTAILGRGFSGRPRGVKKIAQTRGPPARMTDGRNRQSSRPLGERRNEDEPE